MRTGGMRVMRICHFATFVVVVEERSLSRAARRLHYAVSTVSAHVSDVERWVGVTLLVRCHDGVAVTDAGHRMYGYARAITLSAQDAIDGVRGPDAITESLSVIPKANSLS